MTTKNDIPPYPRFGECLRALALAFDTKAGNLEVDRLARDGDYDWSLIPRLSDALLLAPLTKYVDPGFAALLRLWLEHMQQRYRELILGVTMDKLGRPEVLPILVATFFAPQAGSLLVAARKEWGGPALARLLDPAANPLAVVMEWLDAGEATPLAKLAFPRTTDHDRTAHEKYRKWIRGADLPTLGSLMVFADAVERSGALGNEKMVLVRRWLVLGRALAYLERAWTSFPVRAVMLAYSDAGMPEIDVQSVLLQAAGRHRGRYAVVMPSLSALYQELGRSTPKQAGAQERTESAIDALERLMAAHDPEGHMAFHLAWLKGRWHALSGRLDEALRHIEHAARLGSYRAGAQLVAILEEGLVLAAVLKRKPGIKRFKNQAVAAGLFADPKGEMVVEEWEIEQAGQQFQRLFPPVGRFPEADPLDEGAGMFGLLVLDREEMHRLRPDLKKPDRVRSLRFLGGEVRRQPQLAIFAALGKSEEVAALLGQGASVDQLDDGGGSALLCALQHAEQTGDRRALDLLLAVPHAGATLDAMTTKKQITPLFCAIDLGEPDVVERLLGMGASAEHRANIVDETALYYAVETLGSVRQPARLLRYLQHAMSANRDLVRQEVMRRYAVNLAGVFGDGHDLQALRENERYDAILRKLIGIMVEERLTRHSQAKLLRIVELLLQHGANPNARHDYPAPGRTPLMLAAENDSAPAFDMMLQRGGDPYLADATGRSSLTLAQAFRSANVVRYLRAKGVL